MKKMKEIKARIENRMACRAAGCSDFATDNAGMGTIEIVLIIVVLISLVLIFKKNISAVLDTVFTTINDGVTEASTL